MNKNSYFMIFGILFASLVRAGREAIILNNSSQTITLSGPKTVNNKTAIPVTLKTGESVSASLDGESGVGPTTTFDLVALPNATGGAFKFSRQYPNGSTMIILEDNVAGDGIKLWHTDKTTALTFTKPNAF